MHLPNNNDITIEAKDNYNYFESRNTTMRRTTTATMCERKKFYDKNISFRHAGLLLAFIIYIEL